MKILKKSEETYNIPESTTGAKMDFSYKMFSPLKIDGTGDAKGAKKKRKASDKNNEQESM